SGGNSNNVRSIEARGKMRHQIIVEHSGSVFKISSGGHKKNAGGVQLLKGIEERLGKLVAAQAGIEDPYICALCMGCCFPKVAHLAGVLASRDRVRRVTG